MNTLEQTLNVWRGATSQVVILTAPCECRGENGNHNNGWCDELDRSLMSYSYASRHSWRTNVAPTRCIAYGTHQGALPVDPLRPNNKAADVVLPNSCRSLFVPVQTPQYLKSIPKSSIGSIARGGLVSQQYNNVVGN